MSYDLSPCHHGQNQDPIRRVESLVVNPLLAIVVSTAVWFALSMRIWGGGPSSGDGRYNEAGGPYDVY